jgi:hypothetical protein
MNRETIFQGYFDGWGIGSCKKILSANAAGCINKIESLA